MSTYVGQAVVLFSPIIKEVASEILEERQHQEPQEESVDFKPCPFCGGIPELIIIDDEGNHHDESYIDDPWSGLAFKLLHHYEDHPDCPIAVENDPWITMGMKFYDSKEQAVKAWNTRQ